MSQTYQLSALMAPDRCVATGRTTKMGHFYPSPERLFFGLALTLRPGTQEELGALLRLDFERYIETLFPSPTFALE
jgi:hypothetical protein